PRPRRGRLSSGGFEGRRATAAVHAGPAGMIRDDVCDLEISAVAPLLRERRLSPVELTDAYLDRIQRLDPSLNSYIRVMPDQARAAARQAEREIADGGWRGPLHGVTIGIKDRYDVAGVPTTMGSSILRDYEPDDDVTVVSRRKSARRAIQEKQNLHSHSFSITSENRLIGA